MGEQLDLGRVGIPRGSPRGVTARPSWIVSTKANAPRDEPQRRKASNAINRRFTQMDTERNPFKNITAEAPFDGLRVVSRVEPQRAQRMSFLFVGRRRQTKTFLKLELKFLPNRLLPIGQKGFPQRTLRLCGEMTESLSAKICG